MNMNSATPVYLPDENGKLTNKIHNIKMSFFYFIFCEIKWATTISIK